MYGFLGLMIPILALSIPIVAIWTQHQRKILEIQAKIEADRAAQYSSGNSDLEERVRVLERIVTDQGYDVASQIEALRDRPSIAPRAELQETERNS